MCDTHVIKKNWIQNHRYIDKVGRIFNKHVAKIIKYKLQYKIETASQSN
jgi:hypothetical protein